MQPPVRPWIMSSTGFHSALNKGLLQQAPTQARLSLPKSTLLFLLSLSFVSTALATINCALPAGQSYKAGDPMVLDWGSDGNTPIVTDVTAINADLYCNSGEKIANVTIPNTVGPYSWIVPSVGNATTVGGTIGTCPSNAFHIEYSGMAWGFLKLVQSPWGPVRCGTITILPAPNGTVTTTTTTMSSTSTSSTSTPSATDSSDNAHSGGISTVVIIVIAVVGGVLLTLAVVAMVVYFRRQKKRRLEAALMSWSAHSLNNNHTSPSNAQFSKVSSAEDPSGSPGMSSVAGAGLGGMVASRFATKPQPATPQPSRAAYDQQDAYYQDEGDYSNYAYQQHQQQLLHRQQDHGYNNNNNNNNGYGQQQGYEEDTYYNPYYAHAGQGQGQGQSSTQALGLNQSNPSFYNNSNPGNTPNSHLNRSPFSHDQSAGYFPPPPPIGGPLRNGSSASLTYARSGEASADTTPLGSALTSIPMSSGSDSPRRGPQTVMAEMGRKEAEDESSTVKVEATVPK